MEELLRRIGELAGLKRQIIEEMSSLIGASGLSRVGLGLGCLRLEEVYCVKRGRRYGPYGPYYYLYFHTTEKLEKRYLGKQADRLSVGQQAVGRLRELDIAYRRILKLERRLTRVLDSP